jgi:serine/threonine protein kinase
MGYLTRYANLGGGIIDMMNRRLRERLTEAEILQIFADVCEGVAVMHNLRPPLLHRDLKVYITFYLLLSMIYVAAHRLTRSFNHLTNL